MKRIELTDDQRIDGLYSRLSDVYEQVKNENRIDIFGDIDFEVVDSIDGNRQRMAKLKGKKIIVHEAARSLPKTALRYVIAHELAHSVAKGHTKKFWKVVETIYPNYETGQRLLLRDGPELLKK